MPRVVVNNEQSLISINARTTHKLPAEVSLSMYHQLRVIKAGDRAYCYFDDVLVDAVEIPDAPATAAVIGHDVQVAVEMIRLTSI